MRLLVRCHLRKILTQLHQLAANRHLFRPHRHIQLIAHIGRARLFYAAFLFRLFQLLRQLINLGIFARQHFIFGFRVLAALAQRQAQLAHRHPVHIVQRHAVHFLAVCQPD